MPVLGGTADSAPYCSAGVGFHSLNALTRSASKLLVCWFDIKSLLSQEARLFAGLPRTWRDRPDVEEILRPGWRRATKDRVHACAPLLRALHSSDRRAHCWLRGPYWQLDCWAVRVTHCLPIQLLRDNGRQGNGRRRSQRAYYRGSDRVGSDALRAHGARSPSPVHLDRPLPTR